MDADNQALLVKRGLMEIERRCQGKHWNANQLAISLRNKFTNTVTNNPGGTFDWKLLGQTCVVCFRGPPEWLDVFGQDSGSTTNGTYCSCTNSETLRL